MAKVIFHIDVNSAYLSWTATEQLKNGAEIDIRTIPAIIGGDQKSRHGIVLAKSIPAKRYGIHTGEPVANAFRKCSNLKSFPPDHKMYREKSRDLIAFLAEFCPNIEQVSVDECYMDATDAIGRGESPVEVATALKDRVRDNFGFTVNIGISENKLLAKMASDFEKPDKVHTLFPGEIQEKMWPLPMRELFMAGKSSVETLRKLEILTIGDLAKTDPRLVELHLKSHGRMLWEFANGIDRSQVQSEPTENKGIGNSVTLREDLTEEGQVWPVLLELAESVGRRLRKAGQKAGMVSVEMKYYTFQRTSHQQQLQRPGNEDEILYQTAKKLFREMWTGEPIRLLGIRTSKLVEAEEPEQLSLFDLGEENEKQKRLNEAMDSIRSRFGEGAIQRGVYWKKDGRKEL
ncbi:DNA polymerase IV [Mediterraneibacter butyricigenes]|uniref:DNA polymerase IV n=1 Tax=Mediterraneibacter butyricigenes TaxID=2316025 RepID=A0A391NXZ2_9FIRM|nr:DNA polymerase IV [Mediterraneibacter butyricigenes]GCA66314.1 DNA polymerase IV [Mediterraneibacter butyricigenes]